MAEIEREIVKKRYKLPVKNTTKVRLTHKNIPQESGSAFVITINNSIIGIENIENFFHILNILSEKKITKNDDTAINKGVNIKKEVNS